MWGKENWGVLEGLLDRREESRHRFQLCVSIAKVPPDNHTRLATTNDPSSVKLEFKYPRRRPVRHVLVVRLWRVCGRGYVVMGCKSSRRAGGGMVCRWVRGMRGRRVISVWRGMCRRMSSGRGRGRVGDLCGGRLPACCMGGGGARYRHRRGRGRGRGRGRSR